MRMTILHASVFAALMTIGAPAMAVTKQQAPTPGSDRARIADSDEVSDRLAERSERASRQRTYDRTSARSVMEIGSPRPR